MIEKSWKMTNLSLVIFNSNQNKIIVTIFLVAKLLNLFAWQEKFKHCAKNLYKKFKNTRGDSNFDQVVVVFANWGWFILKKTDTPMKKFFL